MKNQFNEQRFKEKLALLLTEEGVDEHINTSAEQLSDYVVSMLGLLKACNDKREEFFEEKFTLKARKENVA